MTGNRQVFSKHFNIEEITRGVYAAIAIEGQGAMGNTGIIDLGENVLIFDTFNTQQAAEDLKMAAEELTGHQVQYVVNSHWHGDHIRGNQVFASSIIISSTKTLELMSSLHPDRIQRQKAMLPKLDEDLASLREKMGREENHKMKQQLLLQISFLKEIGLSLPDLVLTLPNLTFDSSLTIHGTTRKVQVISMGTAHTQCDSILYLPDERIAFTADILSIDNHPALIDGEPDNWVKVLDQLKKITISTIVPGHGPVGKVDSIENIKTYIQDLSHRVEQFTKQGNPIDLLEKIEMPAYCQGWNAEPVFYQNLRFLYEKLKSREIY